MPVMSEAAALASNIPEYTVGEISQAVKRTLEGGFERIRVRGEISGCKRHSSGHLYLSLKDSEAVLDAVCWRNTAGRLAIKPEDGLEVVATGRLTTYPGRSKYQLVIDQIEIAGEGALLKLLEERRRRLAAEGLFDASRKRKIPTLPRIIGVITSPTGAVIRDILHRLADRFPRHVLIWPVAVQGEGAAEQVAAAIGGFNALPETGKVPRPDLLIVARGGGSLEDLWAFNEEVVVRAAAASAIPLVSAVGHETDTTLIDFAADVRAPTPTAAAELAVPVRAELLAQILEDSRRLVGAAHRLLGERRLRVEGLARGLPHPRRLIEEKMQRLDSWLERFINARRPYFTSRFDLVAQAAARIPTPLQALSMRAGALEQCGLNLARAIDRVLAARETDLTRAGARLRRETVLDLLASRRLQLDAAGQLLDSMSYERVLARGFALVRDKSGHGLGAAAEIEPGLDLVIQFADGAVEAVAGGRAAPRRARIPATGPAVSRQGKLL